MESSNHRLYTSLAFLAGILLTLGFKDVYPELEQRFRRARLTRKSDRLDSGPIELKEVGEDEPVIDASKISQSIGEGIEGTIGNTPLIRIKSLSEATGCEILGKAEFLNGAGGSTKDRVALAIIKAAEVNGQIQPGDTIYEGTVGSTGISLATICRARGYKAYICMPDDQSEEKVSLLLKLGATVERVRPVSIADPAHYVNRARTLAATHESDPNKAGKGYFANQFENEANWRTHCDVTGPEIYDQTAGKLDAFVAGAGTGGTITGVAEHLKAALPDVQIVLADPQGSGLFNRINHGVMFDEKEREGTRRRHQVDTIVEGIGLNRLTSNLETGLDKIDRAIRISDGQALAMAKWLVENDGIFIGSSSAVNCAAAVMIAREIGPGHRIVTMLCDSGNRHLSKFWKEAGELEDFGERSLSDILKT